MRAAAALALGLLLAACGDKDSEGDDGGGDAGAAVDLDGDGFDDGTDCDDVDNDTYPGADELCDGEDNDCDGDVDEDPPSGGTWYADDDGDGFGDPYDAITACQQPDGYLSDASDCDDADNDVYPGAPDLCDEEDSDCDTRVDEDGGGTWYEDRDGDGFGDAELDACERPEGAAEQGGDCDDDPLTGADSYPGAEEVCDGADSTRSGRTATRAWTRG
jgi:hypothetical protein